MVNRKDFRPSNKYSHTMSAKDRTTIHSSKLGHPDTAHHRVLHHKPAQTHVALETKYSELHHRYHRAKSEREKRALASQIKSHHYKIVASRNRMYKNPDNHTLLKKLHNVKSDSALKEEIKSGHAKHELIDNTTEVEHVQLVKSAVAPTKTHALRDIGRGIKAVAVGGGQLVGKGLSNFGNYLSRLAGGKQESSESSNPARAPEGVQG